MTMQSWQAMPRSSHAYPGVQEDPLHNSVEGTRDRTEHCHFIFEKILKNPDLVREDAEIYLVGILNGGEVALQYLNANWDFWKSRIQAVALTSVFTKRQTLSWQLIQFLRDRARNWKISGAPKDACLVSTLHWTLSIPDTTLTQPPEELEPQLRVKQEVGVSGHSQADDLVKATPTNHGGGDLTEWAVPETKVIPDDQIICPEFSSSVQDFTEIIFPTVLESVLTFFKDVQEDVKDYKNPALMVEDYEEKPLEVEVDAAKDGVAATVEGVETMTSGEFENTEKGGGEKKEVRFAEDKEGKEKKKTGGQKEVNFAGELVSEISVDAAVSGKAAPAEENITAGVSLSSLDPLYEYPLGPDSPEREIVDADTETARVAGVDLEEAMLRAAGLM